MPKTNPKLRLPLYAILAATILLLAYVLFVLHLREPAIDWAELLISRILR
jgi:hypothetical protein